jgi:hypothetical protein
MGAPEIRVETLVIFAPFCGKNPETGNAGPA